MLARTARGLRAHNRIGSNDIGPEGARALAKALTTCQRLQLLDAAFNMFGAEGAREVALALPSCLTLRHLEYVFSEGGRPRPVVHCARGTGQTSWPRTAGGTVWGAIASV